MNKRCVHCLQLAKPGDELCTRCQNGEFVYETKRLIKYRDREYPVKEWRYRLSLLEETETGLVCREFPELPGAYLCYVYYENERNATFWLFKFVMLLLLAMMVFSIIIVPYVFNALNILPLETANNLISASLIVGGMSFALLLLLAYKYYLKDERKLLTRKRIDTPYLYDTLSLAEQKRRRERFCRVLGTNFGRKVLTGERIVIREFCYTDIDDSYLVAKSRAVQRYLGTKPLKNREEATQMVSDTVWNYRYTTGGRLAICLKETGRVIGYIRSTDQEPEQGSCQIAYALGKRYWKQGLMTEALKLFLGELTQQKTRIYADHVEANKRSGKVLLKCGFKRTYDRDYFQQEVGGKVRFIYTYVYDKAEKM